jgi:hypothetical protein
VRKRRAIFGKKCFVVVKTEKTGDDLTFSESKFNCKVGQSERGAALPRKFNFNTDMFYVFDLWDEKGKSLLSKMKGRRIFFVRSVSLWRRKKRLQNSSCMCLN